MNGEREDTSCYRVILGIIKPKDMNIPKQVQTHITDFLKDPVFSKVTTPVNATLNNDLEMSEFDDNKVFFPTNNGTLPFEVQAMDVDMIESDKSLTTSIQISEKEDFESTDQELTLAKNANLDPKSVSVQCLETISNLEERCKREGLIFNSADYEEDDETSYEVDLIYDHKKEEGEIYYFVKWKNYSTASNTWEPSWHLDNCSEMIELYHLVKERKPITKTVVNYFVRDLLSRKPYDIPTFIKVCALCTNTTEKYVLSLKLPLKDMKPKVKVLLTFSNKKLRKVEDKLYDIIKFGEARKLVLVNLKEWEEEINAGDPSKALVTVENNVDMEKCVKDFRFVQDYINSVNSNNVTPEPVTFCSCKEDCYNTKNDCCPSDSDGIFAYSRSKRLVLPAGYPIFECNDKCSCPVTCTNRVVQHGQKVKVTIFRTRNKGWGLRAQESIEKGQFVVEYLGEIITSEVAEERGRIYDYVARSYLFDLDYGVDNASCSYTVDAGHVGNVAHFINHSCDPNLHVFAVWINQQDPNLPRLAFFARRKISKGEELTFDYKMCKGREESEDSEDDRIPCRCNSKNCRKYLF